MAVALGHRPADLVIRRARVLNVFTAEIRPEQAVAVVDGRIASVGSLPEAAIGPSTLQIDAAGQALLPGFIEGHTHLFAVPYGLDEFLRYAVPGGTTTVITEITELGTVLGYAGLQAALDALADQPIKLFATLPPLLAPLPHTEAVAPTLAQYRELLARPEVLGLGELYWGPLVRGDERSLTLIEAALALGKRAEGHAAGARGSRLQAYAAAGISSCHEPITAEEGLERLRLGLTFMAREGAIRRDLEAIAPIWREPRDLRRMTLVTDGLDAEDLLAGRGLQSNVQRAIDLGLEPARAIQMVTLNVAEHFKLEAEIGAIAPGRRADLLLVPDERTIRPSLVLSDGRLVARDGALLEEPRRPEWPRRFFTSIRRRRLTRPDDFRVAVDRSGPVRVRAIGQVSGLVTQELELELPVREGALAADPAAGLLKVAVLDRALRSEAIFVGFIKGFGLTRGALATSMVWDSHGFVVIGADDRDLALAACRLYDIQGGAVVCADGALLADFEARLGGVQNLGPLPRVAAGLRGVKEALRSLGCPWEQPLLTAGVLTGGAIPFFRITERGYARLRTGEAVGLLADR